MVRKLLVQRYPVLAIHYQGLGARKRRVHKVSREPDWRRNCLLPVARQVALCNGCHFHHSPLVGYDTDWMPVTHSDCWAEH